jgi:hypothetical protein
MLKNALFFIVYIANHCNPKWQSQPGLVGACTFGLLNRIICSTLRATRTTTLS